MKEIIIHIGTHKTGTTALQQYLQYNRDSLSKAGWLYPLSGISPDASHFGHHDIAWHFSKGRTFDFGELFREMAASSATRVILSSEEFESVTRPGLLKEVFSSHALKILIFLRRQDDFLLSSYNQLVKMGIYAKSLQSFRRRLENRGRFDYFALCELWAEHVGRENILARVYDPERPIVEHFFETLGIACPDCSEPKFVHSNRSVDARLIGALRAVIQLRENGFAVDVCDRLLNAIRHYDTELLKRAGASRYVLMNAKDRADLLRNCEAGNQLLSDHYLQGNQFPRIDSSADEIKVSDRFILPELFKELVKVAAGSHTKTEDTGCGSVRDDGGPQVLCASGGGGLPILASGPLIRAEDGGTMSRDCVAGIHRDPDRFISSVDRIGQVASGFVPTVVHGRRFLNEYHRMLSRAPVGRSGHPACIDLEIEGFLQRADALKIYELAYFSQGDVLELGTHKGLSTSIIARALIDAGKQNGLTTVDIDPDVVRTAQDTLSDLGYSQFIEFNVSDATTTMDELIQRGRRFGFIFVDHWHGYTATYEAAIRAVDLLIEGGFVLFHDYNDSRNADPNHPHKVFQAVSDTLAKDPRFVFCTISGCCGLFQKQGWSDPSAE